MIKICRVSGYNRSADDDDTANTHTHMYTQKHETHNFPECERKSVFYVLFDKNKSKWKNERTEEEEEEKKYVEL
jgi:hypothetical protein